MNLRGPLYDLTCADCDASTGQPIDESMKDWLVEEHQEAHPDHGIVVEEVEVENDGSETADVWG